jgi:hypothetical protein
MVLSELLYPLLVLLQLCPVGPADDGATSAAAGTAAWPATDWISNGK